MPSPAPSYFYEYQVKQNIGGSQNPYHWTLDVGGYDLVNVVLQIRGTAGRHFNIQLRHHHPDASVGPTCTYVISSNSGLIAPGGFNLVKMEAVRLLQPKLDIILFGDTPENFTTVVASVYAACS